jgi:SAM-dependent methyltransferase
VLPDILSVVRRYARGTVLDVGCGVGAYRLALRDEPGVVVHSLEYDAASAVAARRNGVNVIRGDARALPVRDRAVGTVIAIELLEHVDDPERAVAELARVARLNAIVTVPNAGVIPQLYPWGVVPWHLMERTHVSFFSACTLEALLRTGFAHVQVGYGARSFGFPGAPPLYDHLVGLAAHGPDDLRPAGRPRR